jgi:RNA polymerase sigma-70 factor (ECF subfamily)
VDKEEFTDLVLIYQRSMYRFALGILRNEQDAEDAISAAIIKAYEHLASLRNKDKFKTWIMSIIANEAKNMISKNSRMQLVEDVTTFEVEVEENQNDIWGSVMELGEQHRRIVILYYYDGFSTREIARILKVREGTVKSRLSRARQNLKEILSL